MTAAFDPLAGWRRSITPRPSMTFFQWRGSKGKMARRIANELPQGSHYVEPYFGAGAVFLRRKPSAFEVINDLDGRVVNFYRVLRDNPEALIRKATATPYARAAFVEALSVREDEAADPVDRAVAFFSAQMQGFAGKANTPGNWGRVHFSAYTAPQNVNTWIKQIRSLEAFHDRIARVQIENRDALKVIREFDQPGAVIYCDPPYLSKTRKEQRCYRCEASDAHHEALVSALLMVQCAAAVSCYDAPPYDRLRAAGWRQLTWSAHCHSAARFIRSTGKTFSGDALRRTEVLWVNPQADAMRAAEAAP